MNYSGWTYGTEHEWGDIPRLQPLPEGYGWDTKDCTIVNSNGIANDPLGRLYAFGGEINTPPTDSIYGQVDCLERLKRLYPMAVTNYRSNMHLHVRVPGLEEDLAALKRWARYNAYWLPRILGAVEPIPAPRRGQFTRELDYLGARRRYNRRKRSHHTILAPGRLALQLAATTPEEFFAAEVPRSKAGAVMWHAQPRAAVNLRQLRETRTVEFRHFPGTLNADELLQCLQWVKHYTLCALLAVWDEPAQVDPWASFLPGASLLKTTMGFPAFPEYQHALEIRYRATCFDGTVPREQIVRNIKAIEDGTFNDEDYERNLKW